MHIYIQRGGQRPSHASVNLSKSRSLYSLQDTSPHLREKIVEYDKKRREQEKQDKLLKPKPPPTLLPPPKQERKKYVPKRQTQIITTTKPSAVISHVINDEKPLSTQNGMIQSYVFFEYMHTQESCSQDRAEYSP